MSPQRVLAQARLELALLLRNGENLLVTFAIPVAMLLLFVLVPVLPTGGRSPVDLLAPGALVVALMGSGLVALGISTAFEREQSVLRRYGVTPLRRGELVAAKALAVAVVQIGQLLVVGGVAVGLGWDLSVTPGSVVVAMLGLALASVTFAGIGLAIAGRLPAMRALAVLNAAFLLLVALGGVTVPLHELPSWLAAASSALPSAWAAALLHGTVGGGSLDALPPVGLALTALTVWAAGSVLVAARLFRWQ